MCPMKEHFGVAIAIQTENEADSIAMMPAL